MELKGARLPRRRIRRDVLGRRHPRRRHRVSPRGGPHPVLLPQLCGGDGRVSGRRGADSAAAGASSTTDPRRAHGASPTTKSSSGTITATAKVTTTALGSSMLASRTERTLKLPLSHYAAQFRVSILNFVLLTSPHFPLALRHRCPVLLRRARAAVSALGSRCLKGLTRFCMT